MNIDGTGVYTLSNPADFCDSPHWSPDSQKLIYLDHDAYLMIKVNSDGSNPVTLTSVLDFGGMDWVSGH